MKQQKYPYPNFIKIENHNMTKVSASIGQEPYKTTIQAQSNTIIVDEPESKGGKNLGLNPMELLAASLASCTAITLNMYATRKTWEVTRFDVEVQLQQNEDKTSTRLNRVISFEGNLDEQQIKRLNAIANACPVHKVLQSSIQIDTQIK